MRWGGGIIALLGCAVTCAAAVTTKPAPTTNPLILDAQRSARGGHVVEIAARIEWPLQQQLKDFAHANPDDFLRLATLRQFGRFFARVKDPDEGTVEAMTWLIAQPKLAPTLMMLTTDFDPPDRVQELLRALQADHRTRM